MTNFPIGANTKTRALIRKLEDRYSVKTVAKAAATALNITAARNRRAVQAQMEKRLDRPRKQTINAVRFRQAKADDGLDRMYSATFIVPFASEFLAPSFYGATLTELHDRKPIITPLVGNLNRGYGLGVKLNRFGNVPGLNKGKIRKVLDSPHTFEVPLNRGLRAVSGETLPPGIWYRNPRNNDLVLLFLYERDTERKQVLDFNKIGLGVYNNTLARNWSRALAECLD